MIKTPHKFSYNGKKWTIKLVKKMPGDDTENYVGLCDYKAKTLYILEEKDELERLVTLIHEILHMAWPVNIVSSKTEEKIVGAIDIGLLEALYSLGLLRRGISVTRKPAARKPKVKRRA